MTPPPLPSDVAAPVEPQAPAVDRANLFRGAPQPETPSAPRPRSAMVRWTLHLTRRAHLYAGLLLVPWVFLYGVTGFLFNHPNLWPDRGVLSFGAEAIRGTALSRLPTAADLAADLLATLRDRGQSQLRLAESPPPRFGRTAYTATVRDAAGETYNVFLQSNGTGTVRPGPPVPGAAASGGGAGRGGGSPRPPGERRGGRGPREQSAEEEERGTRSDGRPAGDERPAGVDGPAGGPRRAGPSRDGVQSVADLPRSPLDIPRGIVLTASPVPLIETDLGRVLAQSGLREPVVTSIRMSPLSFAVVDGDKTWRAEFNADSGALTGRPADAPGAGQEMSFKRFLLRLHTTHHYPEEADMRLAWAVLVDATSLVMIFWGISGIVMWWQIKRTRLLGGLCLLASTCAAAWIGIGMHELLTAAGGR